MGIPLQLKYTKYMKSDVFLKSQSHKVTKSEAGCRRSEFRECDTMFKSLCV